MEPSDHRIEAVVIGGSAGAIAPLLTVLEALPGDFPIAVALVLHLGDDSTVSISEVLAKRCRVPVFEALDKQPFGPSMLVLAAPGYHLYIEGDRSLSLSLDAPVNHVRPSIDVLFQSAALVFGRALLGVVLSGTGTDGADGLRAIRAAGGRTWVQDPASAEFRGLPDAAIARGFPERVLGPDELARRLSLLPLGSR